LISMRRDKALRGLVERCEKNCGQIFTNEAQQKERGKKKLGITGSNCSWLFF
jgi:hypothetical protein